MTQRISLIGAALGNVAGVVFGSMAFAAVVIMISFPPSTISLDLWLVGAQFAFFAMLIAVPLIFTPVWLLLHLVALRGPLGAATSGALMPWLSLVLIHGLGLAGQRQPAALEVEGAALAALSVGLTLVGALVGVIVWRIATFGQSRAAGTA